MSEFYVYALTDPRDKKPFYVGKGSKMRAWSHVRQVKAGRKTDNPYKDSVIKQILAAGFDVVIEILHTDLTENEAYFTEASLIKQYGRRRYEPEGLLTNLCLDANPPSTRGSKKNHFGEKNPNWGKKHPGINAGSHNSMYGLHGERNPNFGSKRSEETKAKQSSLKKGKSYEERYGPERAAIILEKKRISMLGKNTKPKL
jgi:hypothetical protein